MELKKYCRHLLTWVAFGLILLNANQVYAYSSSFDDGTIVKEGDMLVIAVEHTVAIKSILIEGQQASVLIGIPADSSFQVDVSSFQKQSFSVYVELENGNILERHF